VKSTVETLSSTRVRLDIEVPFAELEPSVKKAYRDISAQVTIPGFRRGKVPAAVIDQRVGREAILSEAVQGVIPEQLIAALNQHEVRSLGRPEVQITDFADGQPLKFTAEVDVRPEFTLPDLGAIEVTVDPIRVTDEDVETQVDGLRQRFATLKTVERAAQRGDFVQIDLTATVDGEEVPGGTASNLSHEVGSNQLLPGLDDTITGMGAGESTTFTTKLVAGDFADRDAEVAVTVRTVKERELPALDDDFAQLASEFDTLDELRADLRTRLERVRRVEQLYAARDKVLEALVERADVPAPEGVVRDEAESRRQAMTDQLERMGATLAEYLEAEDGKTEEQFEAELRETAEQAIKVQLVLDAVAEANEIQVTDDEYGMEIVQRASRAGVAPKEYYEQIMRAGMGASVYTDVRRNKAMGRVLERVTITDTDGVRVSTEALRASDQPDLDAVDDSAG
jgi:trigger factor